MVVFGRGQVFGEANVWGGCPVTDGRTRLTLCESEDVRDEGRQRVTNQHGTDAVSASRGSHGRRAQSVQPPGERQVRDRGERRGGGAERGGRQQRRRGGPRRQETRQCADGRAGRCAVTERQEAERRQAARHRHEHRRRLSTRRRAAAPPAAVTDHQVDEDEHVGEDADGEQVVVVAGRLRRQSPGQLDPERAGRQTRTDREHADHERQGDRRRTAR